MLIEVTGHFTDEIILHGKTHRMHELNNMFAFTLEQSEQISSFPHVFCKLFDFELPWAAGKKVESPRLEASLINCSHSSTLAISSGEPPFPKQTKPLVWSFLSGGVAIPNPHFSKP